MTGKILFKDGGIMEGNLIAGKRAALGNLIFDTRIIGYEKVLTSPEYAGKIVCFTYPLIGNYGINLEDTESENIYPSAIIISEYSKKYSNFRAKSSLLDFVKERGLCVIEGIDTQYVTTLIRREKGMIAAVAPKEVKTEKLLKDIKEGNLTFLPDKKKKYTEKKNSPYIALLNGIKKSEFQMLSDRGFNLFFMDIGSIKKDLLRKAKGIYLSSFEENLSNIRKRADAIRAFIGEIPIFATGTGHLSLALACGGKISDERINHYGINHPVSDLHKNKSIITEQSHSISVEKNSLPDTLLRYVNINDGTAEGLFNKNLKIIATAFKPQEEDIVEFLTMIDHS